jgi:hypothetical protein
MYVILLFPVLRKWLDISVTISIRPPHNVFSYGPHSDGILPELIVGIQQNRESMEVDGFPFVKLVYSTTYSIF